jgi:hypothetical protein
MSEVASLSYLLVLLFFSPEGFTDVHLLQFTVTADDLYWAYYLRMRKEIMLSDH